MEPPDDIDPRDLAHEVRSQLRTLSKLAADRVARHLVAAGRLVDEEPAVALEHARAARALGSRVAVVREAVGETAYAAGEWAEAIAELRTARRMTGDDSVLPLIADSERALGRADRALRIAQSPEALALDPAARAEMRIVEAGARRDLGQLEAALITIEDSRLDRTTVEAWSARLWYAYADILLALGRTEEARDWFGAAASADTDGTTDADERILAIDGVEVLEDEDEYLDDEAAGDGDLGDAVSDADPTSGDVDGVDAETDDAEADDAVSADQTLATGPDRPADSGTDDGQHAELATAAAVTVDAEDGQLVGPVSDDPDRVAGQAPPAGSADGDLGAAIDAADAELVDRDAADTETDEAVDAESVPGTVGAEDAGQAVGDGGAVAAATQDATGTVDADDAEDAEDAAARDGGAPAAETLDRSDAESVPAATADPAPAAVPDHLPSKDFEPGDQVLFSDGSAERS